MKNFSNQKSRIALNIKEKTPPNNVYKKIGGTVVKPRVLARIKLCD
jgi:hypothetical protein